jgi:hypothetical protein
MPKRGLRCVKAVETNLMEKEEHAIELSNAGLEVHLPIGHHEIKSVNIVFPNAAGSGR